ncbi:MAG: FG-GAP repeat protein [Candidatus Bathyarchaeota archaeon]|nr:FG-GAP repeat protein [Candidatus Bathyarchaeota archaeon]
MPSQMRRVVVTMPVIVVISSLACVVLAEQRFELRSTLSSQDPQVGAFFGWSLASSSDMFVVRETRVIRGDASDAGQVYVYDSGTLALKFVFSAPNPREGAYSSYPAAVRSDMTVVGEHWADVHGMRDAGQVCVYDSETMELRAILASPNPRPGGFFGWSLVSGLDQIVIGELRGFVGGMPKAGQVYVYDARTLALRGVLSSPIPSEGAGFGSAVAVGSGKIVIGEAWATVNNRQNAGRAYVYDAENLDLEGRLASPDPQADAVFGYAVAVGADLVIVGEPKADVDDVRMAGRVHVFSGMPAHGATSAQDAREVLAISCLFLSSMAIVLILATPRKRIAELLKDRKA